LKQSRRITGDGRNFIRIRASTAEKYKKEP